MKCEKKRKKGFTMIRSVVMANKYERHTFFIELKHLNT